MLDQNHQVVPRRQVLTTQNPQFQESTSHSAPSSMDLIAEKGRDKRNYITLGHQFSMYLDWHVIFPAAGIVVERASSFLLPTFTQQTRWDDARDILASLSLHYQEKPDAQVESHRDTWSEKHRFPNSVFVWTKKCTHAKQHMAFRKKPCVMCKVGCDLLLQIETTKKSERLCSHNGLKFRQIHANIVNQT